MIKNIVFDLGNVLLSFKPSEYFAKENYPENILATILSDVFESKEWILLDKGEISVDEAIDAIASVSSLKKVEIAHIFNLRTNLMFPLDENVKLLSGLKKQGFRLYYLSNFPKDVFDEISTGYYFFKYFDGGIISSEVHVTKPHPRIYELLLEKYSLKANECLFIDDLEPNIRTAELLGMNGLVTYGSEEISGSLREALKMHKV
jgi:epoxide hydrolase-like predicted phosphatase